MSDQIRVLLLGDGAADAPWHPLEPVRDELETILGDTCEVTASLNYDTLTALRREDYPVCISYTDCWKREVTREQAAGLLAYVAQGGSLLVLHTGISLQQRYELLQMMGAKFTGHPPYQALHYSATEEGHGHPLMAGIEPFSVDEEPYMFEFDLFTDKRVFLQYEFEGKLYPAGWEHEYGLGRVVYLQPGHHAPTFRVPAVRRLVANSVHWLARGE